MRIALDTNILAYAEGVNGEVRKRAAYALIARLPDDEVYVPLQALGELFNVLVRKGGRDLQHARQRVVSARDTFLVIPTTQIVLFAAMDLAAAHHLSVWDAVKLAAASSAECTMLLSEDMQDGFSWGGVTVANPFASTPHRLLRTLLGSAPS